MFIPDEPISSIEEDKLGRANFAMKLAQVLHDWEREESIVVGLYGSWGSGKTSLVNMILEQIKSLSPESQDSPVIIRFNPWYFSNTDELLWSFFAQLFAEVGTKSQRIKEWWDKRLKNYARAFSKAEKVPIPIVGNVIGTFGGVLDLAIQEEGLSDYREKLNAAFKDLGRKVIIVIDDLDRLRQIEIRQMLQVVKLNANFPNTIYLLSADREVIERALNTEQDVSGRDYLEKIVQVGFDIPPNDPSYISSLLMAEINRALAGFEGPFDNHRWEDIYWAGFRRLFVTLRDIKRFVNGLSFRFLLVSSEVNIEDFMGLEALRIFAPEVHKGIAENKALFTSLWNWDKREELRPRFDEIFAQSGALESICRDMAIVLFPQLTRVYSNYYSNDSWSSWRKEKRICAPENFDVYFLLGVPVGEVSQAELAQLKTDLQDYAQLKATFHHILEGGRFRRLLERLNDISNQLEGTAAQNLCALLLELGDELPDEPTGPFEVGTDWSVARLIYRLLWKIEEQERCEWLKTQINSKASLFTVLQQISLAESKLRAKEKDEIPFNDACLQELKQTCISRIEAEANARRLGLGKNLNFVLMRWRDWATTTENLESYVQYMTQTPDRTVVFLTGFLNRADSHVGNRHIVKWRMNLKELEQFVNPRQLVPKLSLLGEDSLWQDLSEIERLAIKSFYEALPLSEEEE